jgi:hypothetical protein
MAKWLRTLLAILAHRKFAAVVRTAPDYVGSFVAYTDQQATHASTIGIVICVRTASAVPLAIDHILGQLGSISIWGFSIPYTSVLKDRPEFQSVSSGHYVESPGSGIYGSLGAIIPGDDGDLLLSCSHVIAQGGTVAAGTRVDTLGSGVMVQIGSTIRVSEAVFAAYPTPNKIDAALASVEPGVTTRRRHVEHMQYTSVSSFYKKYRRCGWHWWNLVVDPIHEACLLDKRVFKIGHATLRTDGYVSGVDVVIDVIDTTGTVLRFDRQLQITGGDASAPSTFSAGGDSGAMTIRAKGHKPLGLVFAGNSTTTYVSTVTEIMDHYGIRVI